MDGAVAFFNGSAVVQVIADGSFGLFNPAEVEIQERIGLLAVKGKSRKHQNDRKAGLFGCLNDTFCQSEVHGIKGGYRIVLFISRCKNFF